MSLENQKFIFPKVYAVKRLSKKKRMQSQSGGVFSVIAEYVLSISGVVYGVGQDDNLRVIYKRIEHISQLNEIKGSKYVQAKLIDGFGQVENDLNQERFVLFSGTACMIAGLFRYLEDKQINTSKLITCDLVCHGVAKPQVYADYLNYLEKKQKAKIKKFTFRDKKFGWATHFESYIYKGRYMVSKNYANIFYSHYAFQNLCYQCPFTSTKRITDFTIGDFWGIEEVSPDFYDNFGVSLLLVSTSHGLDIFKKIRPEIDYLETRIEDCKQPNLQRPTEKPEDYASFWDSYSKKGFYETVKKFCDFEKDEDWEYIEKKQYYRRIRSKIKKIINHGVV